MIASMIVQDNLMRMEIEEIKDLSYKTPHKFYKNIINSNNQREIFFQGKKYPLRFWGPDRISGEIGKIMEGKTLPKMITQLGIAQDIYFSKIFLL
jgi:hypothetical protein